MTKPRHAVHATQKVALKAMVPKALMWMASLVENHATACATYFLTVLIILLLFFSGTDCKKPPPIIPPQPTTCEYPAGNRNFTWRLDTIAWWPSEVGGAWAFSDDDAWVMGNMHGPTVPGQTFYAGLHWNGRAWNDTIDFYNILVIANDVTGDSHFMVAAGYYAYAGEKPAIAEFDNTTKKWQRYQFQNPGELHSVWTDGKGYFIAVGDSGMVYTKDGYSAGWVYQKAPTNFNFYRVYGVSKNEVYMLAYYNTSGIDYPQIWRYDGSSWLKLLDDFDSTGTIIKIPNDDNSLGDIYASRCSITDSLRLYIIGWESYLFETKGSFTDFRATNLSTFGLPLRSLGRTGLDINGFSPNDFWVFGTRYNFYHWNGTDFQKMVIPDLPNDDTQFGDQRKMIKTSSGKVFLPTEVSSQVYVVVQGTP